MVLTNTSEDTIAMVLRSADSSPAAPAPESKSPRAGLILSFALGFMVFGGQCDLLEVKFSCEAILEHVAC